MYQASTKYLEKLKQRSFQTVLMCLQHANKTWLLQTNTVLFGSEQKHEEISASLAF